MWGGREGAEGAWLSTHSTGAAGWKARDVARRGASVEAVEEEKAEGGGGAGLEEDGGASAGAAEPEGGGPPPCRVFHRQTIYFFSIFGLFVWSPKCGS